MKQEDENKKANYAIWAVFVFTMVVLLWGTTACKTRYIPVVEEHTKDSVKNEVKVDTFYQVVKDSVVVQMPCNDSIEVAYVDRWHTDYIYKVKEVHDTTQVVQVDKEPQIVEVEKVITKNSRFANFSICWFFLSIAAIAIRLYFKIVMKR